MSPRPLSIPLEPFWNFSKIRGDICESLFITGVNDTGVNDTGDKLSSGVKDTHEKFIAGAVDTGEQFIFPRCCWYHSGKKPKSLEFITNVNDTVEKLFSGVNDTADKFFGGVIDTGD